MKEFHFTTEKEQAEIEQILLQRKKKRSTQQITFLAIFLFIIAIIILYCFRMVIYTEFNGYVVVHNVRFRASEDIFVYDIYWLLSVFSSPQIYSLQELQIILKYVMWISGLYSSSDHRQHYHYDQEKITKKCNRSK